ncbi:MAG: TlpA family protein disulfide reductase [Anaerolineales bacterium]|nr:TlpA family protein disulfide reductase [Anaerolineales bacterium]
MKSQISSSPKTSKSIALMLLGVGLILIGFASVLLIPRAEALTSSNTNASSSSSLSVIPAKVDFPAPELQLTDVTGQTSALSDYAGQVVLVNNWAIWCPPCKRELPDLELFYQKYKEQGFMIVGIEAGSPEADVKLFLEDAGLSFPIWLDPQEKALEAFRNLDLPSSYVMDRNGQVKLAWTGAISYEMLEKHVAPLLNQ